jgi:hypothetical protein
VPVCLVAGALDATAAAAAAIRTCIKSLLVLLLVLPTLAQ